MQKQLKNIAEDNASLDNKIDKAIDDINDDLDRKKLSNDDELCLLYRKNELLNLRSVPANTSRSTSNKPNTTAKKIEANKITNNTPATPPTPPTVPQVIAQRPSTRDTMVIMNTMTPDTNMFISKSDYLNLRREIGNLRQELAVSKTASGDVRIIRDTITVEKRVEIEKPVIVEKIVERVIEKPVIQYVDKVVEKAVPVEKIIERNFTKVEELLSIPPDVVLFDIGKSAIKPQYNARLNFYGAQLKKYKDLKVQLSGFTDATGNAASNRILSEKRAAAVKAYLLKHGASEAQITSEFFGADNPIATNNSAGNKSQNRRVELKFEK